MTKKLTVLVAIVGLGIFSAWQQGGTQTEQENMANSQTEVKSLMLPIVIPLPST